MIQETEIKITIRRLEKARERIEGIGFAIAAPRVFERNLVFDLPCGELKEGRKLLRLREAGEAATLTYKGVPREGGKHKSREERETAVGNFAEMRVILERLGYRVAFVYEKFRTEFRQEGKPGMITIDETPIGNYLELEGEPEWIDDTAKRLGFRENDYLTGSYGGIFAEWRRKRGMPAGNMVFEE